MATETRVFTKSQAKRIKRWIAALRSKKYKQGIGWLRKDNRFCCLGVACDLFRKAEKMRDWVQSGTTYRFLSNSLSMPPAVEGWYGIDHRFTIPVARKSALCKKLEASAAVVFRYSDDGKIAHYCLDTLNDHGVSFRRIAALLERELTKATIIKDEESN